MAHLESKQIVHRDLAARNVLGRHCDHVTRCYYYLLSTLMLLLRYLVVYNSNVTCICFLLPYAEFHL